MALPRAREARPFYQSAIQRLEDAEFLLEADRTTGAVYLGGYAVECMLKALILSIVPPGQRADVLDSFRGARAHDYEWLRARYRERGGPTPPMGVAKGFLLVATWSTNLRYQARATDRIVAESFLKAARDIIDWGDGRL